MFRLNRNERSHWSGNGVHVESELVFMIGRNMQSRRAIDGGAQMASSFAAITVKNYVSRSPWIAAIGKR
ncbi:hypothetical protein, partial [Aeromonas caviae]|uniref:hypothetical protein n=1 Tax=Aeromonas caviae TaxID=648 RepID=UPI001FC8E87D